MNDQVNSEPKHSSGERPYPKVMIECPHLLTFQLGERVSCSMCGSVWGGRPFPAPGESPEWDKRVAEAAAYQEMKWWRKILFTFIGR